MAVWARNLEQPQRKEDGEHHVPIIRPHSQYLCLQWPQDYVQSDPVSNKRKYIINIITLHSTQNKNSVDNIVV